MRERSDRAALILASGSRARRELLHAAGLAFTVVPAGIDEARLRAELAHLSPAAIAGQLAQAKARWVSSEHGQALVIGADQILALGDRIFEKPKDIEAARECLRSLQGVEHELHSAVALAEGGRVSWTHIETARLKMRPLPETAIDDYLAHAGNSVCQSVGAYQIEGLGIRLFERIDGDYFTILGLPLLVLLAELRAREALTA